MKYDKLRPVYDTENIMEYRKWMGLIPYINFPADWKIQMVPPFAAKVVRFRVRLPEMDETDHISVYLDCYDTGGAVGQPYWEVYPYLGDCGRCLMAETDKLLEMIKARSKKCVR
jgi:hypothetical protein